MIYYNLLADLPDFQAPASKLPKSVDASTIGNRFGLIGIWFWFISLYITI